jgi:membrane protein
MRVPRFSEIKSLLMTTATAWLDREGQRLSAALAYYSMLSLAPLLIFIMSIAALAFGKSSAQGQIIGQAQNFLGNEGAQVLQGMLYNAQKPASGILASAIGFVVLLYGASNVFSELRSALNKLWDAHPQSPSGVWGWLKSNLFSIGMVLAIGFLLLIALVISAVLSAAAKYFSGILPVPAAVLYVLDFLITFGGIVVLFALIFRYLPDVRIPWRNLWVGSIVTALLFNIGKYLIGIYLGKAAPGSSYGAAGSLVAVVVWVYYSAMIFYFGAELTRTLNAPEEWRQNQEQPQRPQPVPSQQKAA